MNPPATAWWYRPHDTKASNATSPTRYRVVVPTSLHESVKRYVTHPLPRGGTDLMTRERQRYVTRPLPRGGTHPPTGERQTLRYPPATTWWYRPHYTRASNATLPTRYRVVVPTSLHESVKRYVTHPPPRGGTDPITRERQTLRYPPATAWWYRPHYTRASNATLPTRYRVVPTS